MLLTLLLACNDPSPTAMLDPWVGEGRTRVLVDGIHQLEAPPDASWDETEWRYSHSQTTSRLLANAVRHDARWRYVRDGELTPELLAAHDVLYFNVPTFEAHGSSKTDREMPPLRDSEVAAIRSFMEEGGGVFVVTEHNNAYDNMEGLRPLLEPYGIEEVDAYASETGPGRYAMDVGGYILMARHFAEHPVTTGVRMISWSGGAPFTPQSPGGVAFLSETGFIDRGNYVTKKPMKWSNHQLDEGEYQGPDIPLAVALEVGKGRLVVTGDHNMLGSQWLGVGDNYAFGLNILQWLAGREAEEPWRDTPALGLHVGFEQEEAGWSIGRRMADGYYNFFHNLTRRTDVFARGLLSLADSVDVLGFLDPDVVYGDDDLGLVDAHLAQGRRVLLVVDIEDPGAGSVQLLQRYLPGLVLTGQEEVPVESLRAERSRAFRRERGFGALASNDVRVRGLEVAALDHRKSGFSGDGKRRDRRPKDYSKAQPYLLRVRLSGGEPLVWATLPSGEPTALLQRYRVGVGEGELIVMVQGRIWSGYTLPAVREEPVDNNRPAYDLEMRFLEWLAARPPLTSSPPMTSLTSRSQQSG